MNEKKVVVVLGATGLLGQALVRTCRKLERPVIGLSRADGMNFSGQIGQSDLHAVLDGCKPALVINAVAMTDLAACEKSPTQAKTLNAHLPGALAAWSRATRTPWIQVSTDHYFSGSENALHDEKFPVDPPNEYARSKLLGETLALESEHALVIRTNIVGRRGWPGRPTFAEWVNECLRGGTAIAAYSDSWASSMEVGQCSRLLLALADIGARGLFNLGATQSISKAEFIRHLAVAAGHPTTGIHTQPRPLNPPGSLRRANALGLDIRRASKLLRPLGLHLPCATDVASALAAEFRE
jgi:dTDP-4-dehydrorhamnose reductase